MSPEKRITKRQIKEDKLLSTAFKISEYAQKNKNYFIAGFAVIAVVAIIIYFINYSYAQKNYRAEEYFGQAQLAMAMQQPALALTDYKAILDEYGSTRIADRTCYFMGRTYYDLNNCDSAIYYFDMYINQYGKESLMLSSAYSGAAHCLENIGDFGRAGDYYMKAAATADNELYSPGLYMDAGRAFTQAELYSQAQNAYQMVIDKFGRSADASTARQRLAEVKFKE